MSISDTARAKFRTYTEMPARVPQAVWVVLRAITMAITLGLVVLLLTEPALGLRLMWTLFIPILPLSFVVVPGLWRQICPMALLNQLPRTFGFSRGLTLPVKYKNLAYYFASIAFLAIVETRHFRAGDDIIRMRERDDSFYILTAGSVSVVVPDSAGRDLVIAEIPEGSVFGEIAFFDSEPRSATIRARTSGSAVRITRSNFEHLSAWYPMVARQMLFDLGRILAMRLRWTSTKIAK